MKIVPQIYNIYIFSPIKINNKEEISIFLKKIQKQNKDNDKIRPKCFFQ